MRLKDIDFPEEDFLNFLADNIDNIIDINVSWYCAPEKLRNLPYYRDIEKVRQEEGFQCIDWEWVDTEYVVEKAKAGEIFKKDGEFVPVETSELEIEYTFSEVVEAYLEDIEDEIIAS